MKHILIKTGIVAAALLAFAACDNSDYELDNLIPDEFKRVVCIKDAPVADMQLFDVGLAMKSSFTVLRSGGDPSLDASTQIQTMTQEELTTFGADYILVDPSYYTVDSNISFAPDQRYKVIDVTFEADKIVELRQMIADLAAQDPNKGYYVALKLVQTGETTVNDEKYYILRRVVVSDAELQFSITGDATFKGNTMGLTVTLPFDNNGFTIAWDIAFESDSYNKADDGTESTDLGNSLAARTVRKGLPLEAIQNADVKTLEDGNETLTYNVVMPEGTPYGTYYFNVKFSNPTLNGAPILTNAENLDATIRFDYVPSGDVTTASAAGSVFASDMTIIPQDAWAFVPESQQNTDPAANAIDGSIDNKWENRWGGDGYGTYSVPFNAALDLGAEYPVEVLEVWRRNDGYVADLRSFEVYAAETLDYSNREAIQYSGLTYLGTVDFGDGSNTSRAGVFPMLHTVNARYLLLKFTASNRNGSCISISELCVWQPKVAEQPEETPRGNKQKS